MSRRAVAFFALLVTYAALTVSVMSKTPITELDVALRSLDLRHTTFPESWKKWLSFYVALGQRGPATLIFLPAFLWVVRRDRSPRPLTLLAVALVLLNLSVGIVKIITGRLGPLRTHNAHAVFVGGNIYPSGHVSNAVVLYGLLAWISVRHRKQIIAAAVFLSVTIGIGTIYLNTHWWSDVLGGWAAGGLVLLALPWVMAPCDRWADLLVARVQRRFGVRARSRSSSSEPVRPTGAVPRRSGSARLTGHTAPRDDGAGEEAAGQPGRRGRPPAAVEETSTTAAHSG